MQTPCRSEYRPDIDGLRALSIILVVAFHAFPRWFAGGFIGVDVFFVISGYLITGILLKGLDQGRVDFLDFYARRVLRIFPALVIVLAACLAFGWFALLPHEYRQLGKHATAATGFLSNYVLMGEAGYFDNSAETKPLLHLWSLGIEEQFYLLWPFFLWLVWRLGYNVLYGMALVVIISFCMNIGLVSHSHVKVFYSPQTRFWELAVGGCLAWADRHARFLVAEARGRTLAGVSAASIASGAGLLLILCGLFAINRGRGFPGWWAGIPVLGALLIVGAGRDAWLNRRVLAHPAIVWVGLISFPLYLWHWPLLSLARIMEGEVPAPVIRVAAVVLALLLAWATYVFLEQRVKAPGSRKAKVIALIVSMVAVGLAGYGVYAKGGVPKREALSAVAGPIKKLGEDDPQANAQCMARYGMVGQKVRYCRISGEGYPPVALVGDSHAAALFAGLSDSLMRRDDTGLLMMGGWLFVNATLYPEGQREEFENYTGGAKATRLVAREASIKTVIIAARGPVYLNTHHPFFVLNDSSITGNKRVYEAGMRSVLELMLQKGKQVVVVLEVPTLNFNPEICLGQRPLRISASTHDCTMPQKAYESVHEEYRQLMLSILKDYPTVKLFDPAKYLCDGSVCTAKVESKILYGDDNHLSVDGSAFLAQELVRLID